MGSCTNKQRHHGDYQSPRKQSTHKHVKHSSDTTKNDKPSNLTQLQLQQLISQLFDKYDKGKDGFLDKKDATSMMNDLFMHTKNQKHKATDDEIFQFMNMADENNDKKISKKQLYQFYKGKL